MSTKSIARRGQKHNNKEVVRGFWHGKPLNSYQLLAMRSFYDKGYRVEIFTYDSTLDIPHWITRRDANEIWPTDRVLRYSSGPGRGGYSLHANLFRYKMLFLLGGWWIDLDAILIASELPQTDLYFAREITGTIAIGVLKFPKEHIVMEEAVAICHALGEKVDRWGQTGPILFDALLKKHSLQHRAFAYEAAYPLYYNEIIIYFDPARFDEARCRTEGATFIHLYTEIWRRAELPSNLLPPSDSYLDFILKQHQTTFDSSKRMTYIDIAARLSAFP